MQIKKVTIYREINFPSNPKDRYERRKLGIGFDYDTTDILWPEGFDSKNKDDMDQLRRILEAEIDGVMQMLNDQVKKEKDSAWQDSPKQEDFSTPF